MTSDLCKLPSRFRFHFFLLKFDIKAIFLCDFFVGILFSFSEFSDCMILISEIFLKALKLIVMIICQSFFDSIENCFPPSLIEWFLMFS